MFVIRQGMDSPLNLFQQKAALAVFSHTYTDYFAPYSLISFNVLVIEWEKQIFIIKSSLWTHTEPSMIYVFTYLCKEFFGFAHAIKNPCYSQIYCI